MVFEILSEYALSTKEQSGKSRSRKQGNLEVSSHLISSSTCQHGKYHGKGEVTVTA